MRAGPSESDVRAPLHERWAVAAVHGQACWGCGAGTSLEAAEIVPIVPVELAGQVEELAALGLEPEFDVDGARNWSLACPACAAAGALAHDVRKNLDRAVRRGVMVRRAALEATYVPGLAASLAALAARPADSLTLDDVAALATTWAGFQARKTALVRGTDDPYDFKRDSFAKTTIRWKPPAPLQLSEDVALVFEDTLVERLASLRWSLVLDPARRPNSHGPTSHG